MLRKFGLIFCGICVCSGTAGAVTLYYELQNKCDGFYSSIPTSGCNGTKVTSISNLLPQTSHGRFDGFYIGNTRVVGSSGTIEKTPSELIQQGVLSEKSTAASSKYECDTGYTQSGGQCVQNSGQGNTQQDCVANGGTWSNGQCTYRVYFVQNAGMPYQEQRPVCSGTYIAGQTTQMTCDTQLGVGTFFGWCLDDQLKSACNTNTHSKTVIIPPTAKGHLVYYAKWQCNDRAWMTENYCAWHIYETTWVETTPATYVPVCNSSDTSGCMNNSECSSAGGTWDSVAGICYKGDTFGWDDRTITVKFSCGTGSLRRSDRPIPSFTGKMGDSFTVPNAYEYCKGKEYTGPNFVGWLVGRGVSGDNNATLSWDSDAFVRIPKTNNPTWIYYNVTAKWSRGSEHACPDNYPAQTNTKMHHSGRVALGCPTTKCGDEHYYGDWSDCTLLYERSTHKEFVGWCSNSAWTSGCSANPFASYTNTSQFWDKDFYDKWVCTEGYTQNSTNKECECTQGETDILYETYGGNKSSRCPTKVCGSTPTKPYNVTSSTDNYSYLDTCNINFSGTDAHRKFEAWCTDADWNNCATSIQFRAGQTYYAKYGCYNGYSLNENRQCVKDE
ncbi:MAG: hypothetical protein J5742_03030 [Alphaproteobacteria bacterium]|nr:hypothetical protein [Alphaproteobacteria bacterium]